MRKPNSLYKIKKLKKQTMEVFDKDGNPVANVFSQEELDAKLAAEKTAWEEANKPPESPAAVTPPAVDPNEPPVWFKPFADKVDRLAGNQTTMVVQDYTNGLDAEKRAEFDKRFNGLTTGYEDTPEGQQKRASDAYLLATGQPYTANEMNTANFTASQGHIVRPSAAKPEIDTAIQGAFGVTAEDAAKYGNK